MKKSVAAIIIWLMLILILQIPVHAQIGSLPNDTWVMENVTAEWLYAELIPMDNPIKVYGCFNGNKLLCEIPAVFDDIIIYCIGEEISTVASITIEQNGLGLTYTLDSISIP